MQTPKARNCSSEVPKRRSPAQSGSSRVAIKISQDGSQKMSPGVVRKLLPSVSDSTSSSPHVIARTKQRSPIVNEQRSPHSLGSEKRPSRRTELESQISELQNDLKKVKEELRSTEALKDQANQDADESKKQLAHLSSKLEDSQKQLLKPAPVSDEASAIDPQTRTDLNNLKQNLSETLLLLEGMKMELRDCKESEAQAQALVNETLLQLETAKRTAEILRSDRINPMEVINNRNSDREVESEISAMESEIESLRDALEAAEVKNTEEQTRSTVEIRSAYEFVEHIISCSNQKEAELKVEVQKLSIEVEELKANLMDKETELQGICEENETLASKLENKQSGQREYELEIENLKADLTNKETEMQKKTEEDARRNARVMEQLDAVQASNAEMEAELRMLKVQCDQWRKAAEAAASILSSGDKEEFGERKLDSHRSGVEKISPYHEDGDEDLQKRKNANMLKRLGISWKKQQK